MLYVVTEVCPNCGDEIDYVYLSKADVTGTLTCKRCGQVQGACSECAQCTDKKVEGPGCAGCEKGSHFVMYPVE